MAKPKKKVTKKPMAKPPVPTRIVKKPARPARKKPAHGGSPMTQNEIAGTEETATREDVGHPPKPHLVHVFVDNMTIFGVFCDENVYKWHTPTGEWKLHKDGV